MGKNERVTFYIDGFNFYFGLKKVKETLSWPNYYWLDVARFCKSFLDDTQELAKAIYFTAAPVGEEKSSRQSAFLNANKILNPDLFEIVRGKYIEKEIRCRLCNQVFLRPEEKKTDVNISVRMIKDCIQDKTDKLILVSADSDLIPPLEAIRELFPKKRLKVYFPPAHFSRDIKNCIWRWKEKPVLLEKNERRFKDALMSDLVCEKYSIPEKWKQQMK